MDDTSGDATAEGPWDAADRAAEANALHRPVVIGPDVVSRPAGPGSATVHDFLRHLRATGLTCVPEPLAIDDGVETLRFIPGADGGEGWYHQHTDRGLASAARLLRRIHDAGADWTPPEDAVWGADAVPGADTVFCHGDPGPWNFIWRDQEAVALIDWDYLHPAPRLDDVAYALRWFAPLRSDAHALDWHHFPEVPDRRARVQTFVEAYGGLAPFDVADVVVERIRSVIALMHDLAEQGIEPQRTWVADGADERDLEEIAWIEAHRDDLDVQSPPSRDPSDHA
ncbi:Phosphotransferase enzyme family protein [Nocardioides alpinus]|uniref:Aminoglycoside phosphotransferase family protein n=1 Tax=Nocardioides alpinus TaxID=748909 RepID=A0A1I1AP29_9ACTN|nr:aminoglycoside phosphotransferase family protein [Nocardioides alpinus]PKH41250.1 aminoglycoside phosphotransferase family protein [Nocardioides alpinus]SFB39784.1 Phosphotransferase enzyme family protein [Nocardioides alpinus]